MKKSTQKRILIEIAVVVVLLALLAGLISQPTFRRNHPSQAVVSSDTLRSHVLTISKDFHPRSFKDRDNLARCARYIRTELHKTGAIVTNQDYEAPGGPYQNVVALYPGTNAVRIVLGAHYDACDKTPGADDNASGVAGLLELARLIGGTPHAHTIELVAYCTEEPPFFGSDFMGSAFHAKSLKSQGVNLKAMLALEMIGHFNDEASSQRYPALFLRLFYPSRGNFIGVIGNLEQRQLTKEVKAAMRGTSDLPVYSAAIPTRIPGIDFSDHRNYWACGYPAVMITDTAAFRNHEYHEAGDLPETLDYDRMAKVVVGVYEAVRRLDAEER